MKEFIIYNPPYKAGFWRLSLLFENAVPLTWENEKKVKKGFISLSTSLAKRYGGTFGYFEDPSGTYSFLLPSQVKDKKLENGQIKASAPFREGRIGFLYDKNGNIRGVETFLVIFEGQGEPLYAIKIDESGKVIAVKKTENSPWSSVSGVGFIAAAPVIFKVSILIIGLIVAGVTAYFFVKQLFNVDKILTKFSDGFAQGAAKGGKLSGTIASASLGFIPLIFLIGFALSQKEKVNRQ